MLYIIPPQVGDYVNIYGMRKKAYLLTTSKTKETYSLMSK